MKEIIADKNLISYCGLYYGQKYAFRCGRTYG